jgi:hypothetical protein
MSGRELAKFTSRLRDCRSPAALARRSDYKWVTPVRPPIVSITPPKPPQTEPSKPDFSVRTVEVGRWSSDGRYWIWDPPREKKEW